MHYGFLNVYYEIIVNMKCPKDNVDLILKSQENVFGYCCPQCNGVFLKSKSVKAFKYNFETDLLEKAFDNTKSKVSNYSCCNCSHALELVDVGDMNVLICKKCTSAFFEKGQLRKIKNKYAEDEVLTFGLVNFLPPSLLAIYSLIKYFSLDDDAKNKNIWGWMFLIGIFFSVLFWMSF